MYSIANSFLKFSSLKSNFSMELSCLEALLIDIEENKRSRIIEFGSGLSTFCIAEYFKSTKKEGRITTIESDPYWLDDLKNLSIEYELTDFIDFVYAPVFPDERMGGKNKWYCQRTLGKTLSKNATYDCVVIDGPKAFYEEISLSRYGALPFIYGQLEKDCSIFLDDATRDGEKQILKLWNIEFGLTFSIFNNRLAFCYTENSMENNKNGGLRRPY